MEETPTIKQLMAAAKINQTQLAQKLGVKQPYISKLLNPKADPRLSTIKWIAKGMGVSWQDLAATYEDPEDDRGGEEN